MAFFFLIIYFFLLIVVAFYSRKYAYNSRAYLTGASNPSFLKQLATMFATYLGAGGSFGLCSKVYENGIVFVIIFCAAGIQQLISTYMLLTKLFKYKNCLSIGRIMYKFYGKVGLIIGGVCSIILCLGMVGTQLSVFGYISSYFFHVPHHVGVCVGFFVTILYTSYGGLKAIIETDLLQSIWIILSFIIFIIYFLFYHEVFNMIDQLPPYYFCLFAKMSSVQFFSLFFCFLLVNIITPPFYQRLRFAANIGAFRKILLLSSILICIAYCIFGLIGTIGVSLLPQMNGNNILLDVISYTSPMIIQCVVIIGIISILMSTIDSFLHCAVSSFSSDILPFFRKIINIKCLKIIHYQIFIIIFGLFTCSTVFILPDVIKYMMFSFHFWIPTVVPCMILGLYNVKTTSKILLGILPTSFIISVYINYFLNSVVDGNIYGFIFSFISILLTSKTMIEKIQYFKKNTLKVFLRVSYQKRFSLSILFPFFVI